MPTLTTEQAVDPVFLYIFAICAVMLVGITVVMVIFLVRYRRSKHPHPEPSPHSSFWMETTWTVLPTLIVLTMFWYGWQGYTALTNVPPGAMKVHVIGRQWSWEFRYANGRTSSKLYVPVGRAVVLDITSEDVIHSFYIPSFRVKKDAVPGMHTHLWFRAPTRGSYNAFCAEYCGVGHSSMITTVVALPEKQFEEWYEKETPKEEGTEGRQLLTKNGCTGCHSLDGSKLVGPTFKGLFGRQEIVVTAGRERTIQVDADYIKHSILEPQADLVKGFPPVMPSFKEKLSDHDLETIVDYFKAQAGQPTSQGGKELATKLGCFGCHSDDGSKRVGPSFKGLFGSKATVLTDGKERVVTVDAAYIKRSLEMPKADVVKGFAPLMPTFDKLEPGQQQLLIDYLKSLQ